ncbi:ammonium transporter [Pyrobaculum islandicum DSM 4184]|uniref:Ammonium transporter n=1 Tax=Pyrobaculum islandicum (strain DSM 4184 / JCM 9189 / GEO3) TaxID=384616 RepID=A1RUI0_PYRIL|nr:ammonium transporter [Pyrobaculum islandicum]ABL88612.1 ammonium transporter [Pyrobaculum islandicum DSM 4184]
MQVDLAATVWTALGGILVFLMIPAVGFLEAGLVRRSNVINAMMKGLLAVMVFFPIWFVVFPYYYGGVLQDGFYPTSQDAGVPAYVYGFFMGAFGSVTLAILFSGAPERLKFGGWLAFAVFFSAVQWPLVSSWVWANGFLANLGNYFGLEGLGVRDFAGGTVVHAYAALAGAVATALLGPTALRAVRKNGGDSVVAYKEAVEYKRAELPYAIVGTTLLFFGWFGFNGGSTIVVSPQTGYAIANTAVSGSLGGLIAVLLARLREGVWSPVMAISGVLAGLVAITPLAGYVELWAALLVGALSGAVAFYGTKLVERYMPVDDPVGSLPVHGFNGVLGSALVPVLASPDVSGGLKGLVYGGPAGWVLVQWLGMAIALVFVVATTAAFFYVLIKLGFRVKPEEELVGLDIVDHGVARV